MWNDDKQLRATRLVAYLSFYPARPRRIIIVKYFNLLFFPAFTRRVKVLLEIASNNN